MTGLIIYLALVVVAVMFFAQGKRGQNAREEAWREKWQR